MVASMQYFDLLRMLGLSDFFCPTIVLLLLLFSHFNASYCFMSLRWSYLRVPYIHFSPNYCTCMGIKLLSFTAFNLIILQFIYSSEYQRFHLTELSLFFQWWALISPKSQETSAFKLFFSHFTFSFLASRDPHKFLEQTGWCKRPLGNTSLFYSICFVLHGM
jgi:hypothetical protein